MAIASHVRCTPAMPDAVHSTFRAAAPTRAEIGLACAIGLAVVALRTPLMDLPLERDEGDYAYAAWRMTFGEWPYVDVFNQKPPGVFFAYRAAGSQGLRNPSLVQRCFRDMFTGGQHIYVDRRSLEAFAQPKVGAGS